MVFRWRILIDAGQIFFMRTILLFYFFIFGFYANGVQAFSAFASIKGYASDSLAYSYNYGSQKEADRHSLALCRKIAEENGIGHLAKKCAVALRGKGPGFGAFTCGDNGCAYVTGYDSSQDAVDAAYDVCDKSYRNCRGENIKYGEDTAGFGAQRTKNSVQGKNCIPNTSQRSCQSQCTNGDCLVTYQNGCKVRVQVTPQFNPMNNSWEYLSPGC